MDAATAEVLRDVALLVSIALAAGVLAYGWLRHKRPALAWNCSGHVNARPFNEIDALVVAAPLALLLLNGLKQGKPGAVDAAVPELSSEVLLLSSVFNLLFCAALLVYLLAFRGLHPVDLFGLRRQQVAKVIAIAFGFILPTWVLIWIFGVALSEWMKTFWPNDKSQDLVEAFRQSDSGFAKFLTVFAAVIVAPLLEEVVFRGFVYGVIKRFTDSYFAALCSALLFAIVHFHMGSFFPLVLLALSFCLAYELTGNLLVPMSMHAIFNATSLALLTWSKGVP